ncbi:MAG: hypothetical protein ABI867_23365 [Kofleriaceae bacterium]
MKIAVAASLVMALAGAAAADGSKLLVLQSEGRADAKVRARIDATVLKLARAGTDTVTPSEITYSDAAALVGCKPEDAACKDEVINSLAVDEIVMTTVTPKPGGLEVAVRRIGRNGAMREATVTVPADKPDKLDAVAMLFVVKAVGPTPPVTTTTPPVTTTPPTTAPIGPQPPITTTTTTPPSISTEPPTTEPIVDPAKQTDPSTPAKPLDQPVGSDDRRDRRRNHLRIAGMAGGGGMFLLGVIFWGNASGIENDVNNTVVRSKSDLEALQELESRGDRYARWGNVFVLGGLALGGVSTYFFIKARRDKQTPTTAVVPLLFDHGGGIGLSFGGR